jgi:membrane fusion protein
MPVEATDEPLFRREPIERRSRLRTLSEPSYAQPKARTVLAWIVLLGLASSSIFISTVSYTQATVAYGQLSTRKGITRVRVLQRGIVTAIHVKEGDFVAAGASLFETSADRPAHGRSSLRTEVTRELRERLETATSELADTRALHESDLAELRLKIDWLSKDVAKQKAEIQEAERSVDLCAGLANRAEVAFKKHLIAREMADGRSLDLVDRRAKLISAQRQFAKSDLELKQASIDLSRSAHQARLKMAPVLQRASSLRQELSEVESQTSELVIAPHAGVVTSLATSIGQTVDAGATLTLLSHVDDSAIIHIYVPGSAIAYIKPGDTVVLESESLDTRNIGNTRAIVESIPSFPMTSPELSQIAGGLPHAEERAPGELLFDVIARPQVQVGDAHTPLLVRQKGMTVRAILPLKTRKLYEWMVDPLKMAKERQNAHGTD